MSYFYRDGKGDEIGPYTMEELRQLHLNGVVKPETEVMNDQTSEVKAFRELWASSRAQDEDRKTLKESFSLEGFTRKAAEDLRVLLPNLLLPFQELKRFRWRDNKTLISLACIGLLPLMIDCLFTARGDVRSAYWAMALYFSAWWGLLFFHLFPVRQIEFSICFACFFGTGVLSIGLLLPLYQIPPLSWLYVMARSNGVLLQLMGMIFGVGIPEELCKMAVLLFLVTRGDKLTPQSMLFYGLMAGLGFGIYEGVGYQMGRNWAVSGGSRIYYLSNLIRLTSLPFLHAIWTGMAGYFIGFAWLYPTRKIGLLIVAIGIPAILHGLYDVFAANGRLFAAVSIAAVSVIALYLYLAKSVDFESFLARHDELERS
jgi:protease PrsW